MKTIKYTGLTIVACIDPMDNFESLPRKPVFAANNATQPVFQWLLARDALDFSMDLRRFLLQVLHVRRRFHAEEQNI
jgi:hypothetical protein